MRGEKLAARWDTYTRLLTERWQLLWLLRLADRHVAAGLCLSQLLNAILPATVALASGWLITSILAATTGASADAHGLVLPPLVLLSALLLLNHACSILKEVIGVTAGQRIDGRIRREVRDLALSPSGITHLERADFQDDVLRACDPGMTYRTRTPGTAAVGQLVLTFRLLGAVVGAVILAAYFPLLAVALLVLSLWMRAIIRRQWMHLAALSDASANDLRRMNYWAEFCTGRENAKEMRLFGLGDWAVARWYRLAIERALPTSEALRTVLRHQWITCVLALAAGLSALLVPALAVVGGEIGVSTLVQCLVAAWVVFAITPMGLEAFDIEYGLGGLRALHRLRATDPGHGEPRRPPRAQGDRPPHIRFTDVGFAYPAHDRPILDGLTLDIAPGEVLAVVGHNGVGKTTLIKLLAGLYQPTSGRITVDGEDLTQTGIRGWRRQLCAMFQDFPHYQLSVRDNIALAAPEYAADLDGITEAARRAGALDLIDALPQGMDTILGDGVGESDLSGGQWQKIAIARAMFAVAHGRRILILDEPTSHLDVRAEATFYEQIIQSVRDVSIILISHRLSTVRDVDRIVVVRDGKVVEQGNHEHLLTLNGDYARLFHLQASRFQEADA